MHSVHGVCWCGGCADRSVEATSFDVHHCSPLPTHDVVQDRVQPGRGARVHAKRSQDVLRPVNLGHPHRLPRFEKPFLELCQRLNVHAELFALSGGENVAGGCPTAWCTCS